MMNANDRIKKLLDAPPSTLSRIDDILSGRETPCDTCDVSLITFTEAARLLNVSRPTVYRLTKANRLRVVPLFGVNRVTRDSVYALVPTMRK